MRNVLGFLSTTVVAFALMFMLPAASASADDQTAAKPAGVEYAAATEYFEQIRSSNHPVCCARNGRDWWAPSRRRCYDAGGHTVTHTRCESDRNDRICCKKGRADWWSTRRQCNNRGGYVVRDRQCRND